MVVEAALVELRVPGSTSLKDKRRALRSLIDSARRRFGASVAEVGCQDLLRSAELGIAVVSEGAPMASQLLEQVLRLIEEHPEVEVVETLRESVVLR